MDAQCRATVLYLQQGSKEQADAAVEQMWNYGGHSAVVAMLERIKSEYWGQGYKEESQTLCRRIMEAYPTNPDTAIVHRDAICGYIAMKDPAQAKALLETLCGRYGERADIVKLLEKVKTEYWLQGYRDESQAMCDRIMQAYPDNPDTAAVYRDAIAGCVALKDMPRANALLETFWQRYSDRGEAIVPVVRTYLDDPEPRIRWEACRILTSHAQHTKESVQRQSVLELILAQIDDKDNAILVRRSILNTFAQADFSPAAKALLSQKLTMAVAGEYANASQISAIVLSIGAADMKEGIPRIHLLEKASSPRALRWEGHLPSLLMSRPWLMARARMGVSEDITRCIELVESCLRDRTKIVKVFDELTYVRQPEVIEYLRDYLDRDVWEALASDGDPMKFSSAYYVAGHLAKMLHGFPSIHNDEMERRIRTSPGGITFQELDGIYVQLCRDWMKKQKAWDIIR